MLLLYLFTFFLEIDKENRKLSLGHKQLEENPCDTFATVFTNGSVHKCTVLNKNDKGAVLELPYGLEGFATKRHLVKEDQAQVEVGETLEFKVIDFSKDDRKILLSHTNIHTQTTEKPSRIKETKSVNKANKPAEKSTLGDLEAFSVLKEQMRGSQQTEKTEAKAPKAKAPEAKAPEAKAPEEPVSSSEENTQEEE